jgi:hypothetical protein
MKNNSFFAVSSIKFDYLRKIKYVRQTRHFVILRYHLTLIALLALFLQEQI